MGPFHQGDPPGVMDGREMARRCRAPEISEGHHSSTAVHIQNVQSRAGFGKLASPANQRLDRFSLLVGETKRGAILACAEPEIHYSSDPSLSPTSTKSAPSSMRVTPFTEWSTMRMHPGIDRFGLHKRIHQDIPTSSRTGDFQQLTTQHSSC